MTPPVVCLVTDRSRLEHRHDSMAALIDFIATAARVGVDLIQVREPDLEDRALYELVRAAVSATAGTPARVIVNDRPDIALASGASGVHLKAGSCPATRVKSLAPPDWLIGQSVHTVEEARQVTAVGGLDYVLLGTVFRTSSKPKQAPHGAAVLEKAVRQMDVPVLAIGGITLDTAAAVGRSGAAGMAAIGVFADAAGQSTDVWAQIVGDLRDEFDKGYRSTL